MLFHLKWKMLSLPYLMTGPGGLMKEQQWHFTLTCSCPMTLPKGPAKCQLHLSSTRQEQRPKRILSGYPRLPCFLPWLPLCVWVWVSVCVQPVANEASGIFVFIGYKGFGNAEKLSKKEMLQWMTKSSSSSCLDSSSISKFAFVIDSFIFIS